MNYFDTLIPGINISESIKIENMNNLFGSTLPESIIKTFSIRVKELDGVNLGQGIPSFPTPNHIIAAAREALGDPTIGVYPNFLGTIELRKAICQKINSEYTIDLSAKGNILVSVGAMEGFAATVLSLLDTGDTVGVVTPDYCNHFPAIMLGRGKIVEIPLQEKKTWELDINAIEIATKAGMKLLVLTNPSNPTGAVFGKKEIGKLVDLANRYGFWIISDETYAFLDYENRFATLLEYWNSSDRLIVVRTFSKEYAMTGWRVGYVVAQPELIKTIAKTHDALVGCAPKISQHAALAAITGPQTVVSEFASILKKRRELTRELFDSVSDIFSYCVPHGAYYLFAKYRMNKPSMELGREILEKAHVAVVPGSCFGKGGEGHLRISFAVNEKVLTEGVQLLGTYLRKYSE